MTSLNMVSLKIFRLYHQNCLIFEKISARDNKYSSNFQIASTNLPLFLRKFPLVIGEGQRFNSHQEDCLIFAKILPRDNRARQVKSSNLLYFCKNASFCCRGRSNFQITLTKPIYFCENFSS